MRLIRRYEFDKDAAAARPCQSRPPSITNADAATDNMRIDFFILFSFLFLVVKPADNHKQTLCQSLIA